MHKIRLNIGCAKSRFSLLMAQTLGAQMRTLRTQFHPWAKAERKVSQWRALNVSITLFTFSILPPLKFIETLFFLQTSVKRVRFHSKMIPTNYFILVFGIFLENGAKFENLQKSRINQSFIIYSRVEYFGNKTKLTLIERCGSSVG